MTDELPPLIYDEDRLAELRRSGLLAEETVENFDRPVEEFRYRDADFGDAGAQDVEGDSRYTVPSSVSR